MFTLFLALKNFYLWGHDRMIERKYFNQQSHARHNCPPFAQLLKIRMEQANLCHGKKGTAAATVLKLK